MRLRHIERGMRLQLIFNSETKDKRQEYEASYCDLHDVVGESSFVVQCPKLSEDYDSIDPKKVMEVSFTSGMSIFTFTGRIAGKKQKDMIIIEKMSEVKELNRRIYQRDELRVEVKIYVLNEDMMGESSYSSPVIEPSMKEMCFDISAGGMCIITNSVLKPEHQKFFLIDFNVGDRERFLLPSVLVRRSNYARSRVGKYDYGFQFVFDNMPDEKSRLTRAILGKKLSSAR